MTRTTLVVARFGKRWTLSCHRGRQSLRRSSNCCVESRPTLPANQNTSRRTSTPDSTETPAKELVPSLCQNRPPHPLESWSSTADAQRYRRERMAQGRHEAPDTKARALTFETVMSRPLFLYRAFFVCSKISYTPATPRRHRGEIRTEKPTSAPPNPDSAPRTSARRGGGGGARGSLERRRDQGNMDRPSPTRTRSSHAGPSD